MSKQPKLPANLSSAEVYVARFGSGKADNVFRKVSQMKGWLSHSSSCVSPGKTGILNIPRGCLIWSCLPLIRASCPCLHHQCISPRPSACVSYLISAPSNSAISPRAIEERAEWRGHWTVPRWAMQPIQWWSHSPARAGLHAGLLPAPTASHQCPVEIRTYGALGWGRPEFKSPFCC